MNAHRLPTPDHALHCHPATPCPLDLRLCVSMAMAGSEAGAGLLLCYELRGPLEALRLPAPQTPGPADGLWRHSCFEAFVAIQGETAYREFNFSPSGQWAAYHFSAERVRDRLAEAAAAPLRLAIDCQRAPGVARCTAWLPARALPGGPHAQALCWGLNAVVETADGQLSYWALHHPAPRPDFHHPASRTLSGTFSFAHSASTP